MLMMFASYMAGSTSLKKCPERSALREVGAWRRVARGGRQRVSRAKWAGERRDVADSSCRPTHALHALLLLDERVLPARQLLHAAAHVGREAARHLGVEHGWQL